MNYLIVVAGGKGLRMGGDVPKQFQLLGGLPILMHTLNRMQEAAPDATLILVLPEQQQSYWKALCTQYRFTVPHLLANGGETRFHSVQNGLALVPDDAQGVVGIHDGVRPFVSAQVIQRCMQKANEHGAVIPVIPVVDTVRQLTGDGSCTVNRDHYKLVQTPQTFRIDVIKKAYLQPYHAGFTDDASVVEAMGCAVTLVEGNRENIKITTPFDKLVGEMLVQNQINV